jgi:hypothetical protein
MLWKASRKTEIRKIKMKEGRKHMEKEIVEKELSQLLEITLRLEDELNSIEYE